MKLYLWLNLLSSLFNIGLVHHWIELFLVLTLFFFYYFRNLVRVRPYLLALLIILPFDILITHGSINFRITLLLFSQFMVLLSVAFIYRCLKANNVELLFWILLVDLLEMWLSFEFALHGRNNLFLDNMECVVMSPLFFLLFYRLFHPSPGVKSRLLYLLIVFVSVGFFIYDYATNDNLKFNYRSIILFNLEHFILCCLIVGNAARDEANDVPLWKKPAFWICCGRIVISLVAIVWSGLHPYLLEHSIEVFKAPFVRNLVPAAIFIGLCCYSISFFLCALHCRNKFALNISRFFLGPPTHI